MQSLRFLLARITCALVGHDDTMRAWPFVCCRRCGGIARGDA